MKLSILLATTIIFGATLAHAGQSPGQNFLNNLDIDNNGEVSPAEATEHRANIFASFDYDDDGTLSAEEYDTFGEARASAHEGKGQGGGHGKNKSDMDRAKSDMDDNGLVTFAEFIGQTEARFQAKDRNGDGVVTSADFGPRG
jgi:hypothetical protein